MTQDGYSAASNGNGNGNSSIGITGVASIHGSSTPRTPRVTPLVSPKTLLLLAQQTMTKSPVCTPKAGLGGDQEIDTNNGEGTGRPPMKRSKSSDPVL
jgi:hypothetical protein